MNFSSLKKKLSERMNRLLRIQKEDQALKKQADEIFHNAMTHKEQQDIEDIHKKIDSL